MNNGGYLAAFALCALLTLPGCATVSSLDAAKADAPEVYAGTRLNLYQLQGGCCALERFGTDGSRYPLLDLPGSAVLDTLLLPLSLGAALGAQVGIRGGS